MAKFAIAILTLQFVLSGLGCRTFTDPARKHELTSTGQYWLDYDATRRGTLVVPAGTTKPYVLAEPSPDAAMGTVAEFVGKASYKDISGEASAKVTESIAELGKRTQTIMFLRESMYRLNEMQAATQLGSADAKELFNRVLDVSLLIAQADANHSLAEVAKQASLVDDPVARKMLLEAAHGDAIKVRWLSLKMGKLKPGFTAQGFSGSTVDDYAEFIVSQHSADFGRKALTTIEHEGGDLLKKLTEMVEPAVQD